VELPEVGYEYVGGASALVVSLGNIGGFLVPTFIMASLVSAGTLHAYNAGFLVISIIIAAVIVPTIFLTETGRRAQS